MAAQFGRVREACAAAGRDADSLVYSAAHVVCCGKDEATLSRRAAAIGRDLAELRVDGLAGSPAEIVDKIGAFAEAGTQTLYLQVLDLDDLDHLADIACRGAASGVDQAREHSEHDHVRFAPYVAQLGK